MASTAPLIVLCLLFIFSNYLQSGEANKAEDLEPQIMWNNTHTDELRKALLKNYDKFARPAHHFNVTVCKFGLGIIHLEVSEEKATLSLYTWVRMVWRDEKLKWKESDYGGISVLRVPSHELWKPDIFLYNSAVASPISWSSANMLVYPNGEVLWVPPAKLNVLCDFNFKYWPYDTQECYLKFGSWTNSGDELDLDLYNNQSEADLSDLFSDNNNWVIKKTTFSKNVKYYPCCKEGYPELVLNITIARVSPAYGNVIITPAFVIIATTLLAFWISPYGIGKVILNGLTAVIICLFLLYFTQKLPALGDHTPLIISFYSSALYLLCFAMIESITVMWLVNSSHSKPLPYLLKRQLNGKIGSFLGYDDSGLNFNLKPRNREEELRDHHQVPESDPQSGVEERQMIGSFDQVLAQHEWNLLAAVIDRLFFISYCFIFLILSLTHSL